MKHLREIEYSDGSTEIVDASELYKFAESFAATYGLGGCKTLSEFVRMIDEEDPSVLNGFVSANGIRSKNIQDDDQYVPKKRSVIKGTPEAHIPRDKSGDEICRVSCKNTLVHFLKYSGAEKKEIEEALTKIKEGKIKVSKNDYSHITSETLMDPNFDFEGTLKKMSEDVKNSVQIKVGWDSYKKKQRESNGGRK